VAKTCIGNLLYSQIKLVAPDEPCYSFMLESMQVVHNKITVSLMVITNEAAKHVKLCLNSNSLEFRGYA
jgi:hypothetical protein